VFWLSFFKSQAAVSADEFFGALRELTQINKISEFYAAQLPSYQKAAIDADFVFSISEHAELIAILVQQVADASQAVGFNALRDQIKTYTEEYKQTNLISGFAEGFNLESVPRLSIFSDDKDLASIRLREFTPAELSTPTDLARRTFESLPNQAANHKLHLTFEAVDTDELKNLEISFDGSEGVFKVGEGEANHYQIPNDKKLWETQLMIVCKDGKYFIRDLGVVHTSRIKIDKSTEVQIQQDALVDFGKVVHYHFDKVSHMQKPTQKPSPGFYIMKPSSDDYKLEEEQCDPPTLRARPTWVSSDENKENIQKEIILEAYSQNFFSIGRSKKREVQINLKAVSADHCNITYASDKGWFISEKGKDKMSANGTFVFMKSHSQMSQHEPSDLIPLHDGMVISFINYEIRVNLEKKDADEVSRQEQDLQRRAEEFDKSANFQSTFAAKTEQAVVEEPAHHIEEETKETAAPEEVRAPSPELERAESPKAQTNEDDKRAATPEKEVERAESAHDDKAESPRADSPRAESPKAASEKADSPKKADSPRAATPEKADSPRAATPEKADSPRAATPEKADSPRAATPEKKEDSVKADSPRPATPEEKKDSPRAATPEKKADSPRAATPEKADSPRAATPEKKADSPRAATPEKADSHRADSPKAASEKADSPRAATPEKAEEKNDSPRADSDKADDKAPVVDSQTDEKKSA